MAFPTIVEQAEGIIESLIYQLPYSGAFAKKLPKEGDSISYLRQGQKVNINAYGAVSTAGDYNASTKNYATDAGNTLGGYTIELTDKVICPQTFTMSEMMDLDSSEINKAIANDVCKNIMDRIGSLIVASTFTNTVHEVGDNTTFDRGDLVELHEKAISAKFLKKICMLNTRLYSNLGLDSVLANQSALGSNEVIMNGRIPNIAGFDMIGAWHGMPANSTDKVAGFITDGNALGFASALEAPNYAGNIEYADVIDPSTGLTLRLIRKQIEATHKWNYVAEMLFGKVALRPASLTIIKDTTT